MKILIVSQYFPPYNTPRAFRTFELAKELAKEGHCVTVYSLIGKQDITAIEKKYGFSIKDLGPSRFGNVDSTGYWNKNIIYRACSHIFSKYEFPSFELSFLIKKRIKNVEEYDAIISIAWPFWIHFGIGLLKKNSSIFPIWISDCGDPFTGNPFIKYPRFFKRIEKWWAEKTDFITVPLVEAKQAYFPECQEKIRVIPQGFDFSSVQLSQYCAHSVPVFVYAGSFYEGVRDPRNLLDYLTIVPKQFIFKVYTNEPEKLSNYVKLLGDKLIISKYIKREQLLLELSSADFLINIKNIGTVQSPSKLIDYTLANRPILTLTSSFEEEDRLKFMSFLEGNYSSQDQRLDISSYDIKNVANNFVCLCANKCL